jgi:UDP-glucose-4-epimerase GalE
MILVTGGSGYIGSHTLLALRAAGQEVVVFDDLVEGHREAVGDAPLVVGRLADRALLETALGEHGVEAVVHFAARCYVGESVEDPAKYVGDNVVGMFNLLEAMRSAGTSKLVFSSSCAVYGVPDELPMTEETPRRPISPYGVTKRFCEEMMEAYATAYGFGCVALRYFNACGADPQGRLGEWHEPETHLIPNVLRGALDGDFELELYGNDYDTPDGTCIRDYVHVSDLAEAHVAALGKVEAGGFRAYNLGTERGTSVLEIHQAACEVTGQEIPYRVTPRRHGDPPRLVASAERARAELAWQPRFTRIEEPIRHAWDWLSAHPQGYGRGS